MKVRKAKSSAYHHGDLRATLIALAVKTLKTRSPDTLSLRELAGKAGVSLAAPYRHFKDKQALLAAISQEGFDLKRRYMEAAIVEAKGDALKMYYGCGQAYFKMGRLHPQHFKLMVGSWVTPSEAHPDLMASAAATFAVLLKMITTCQKAGIIGSGDPTHKALNCWAVVNGFTALYAEGRLEWIGVTNDNAQNALASLMSQYLVGAAEPLSQSDYGFHPFSTKHSLPYKQHLQALLES
jgi:AcrR family transcriptional regulator